MHTLEAISARRSIRKFKDTPLPDEIIEQILHAGTLAPSGKNRQPWRFVVVKGEQRAEMVRVMREGIAKRKALGIQVGSSENSARIMAQAPVTVFVFNPYAQGEWFKDRDIGDALMNVVDMQSAGAAIQNMLLAATELGIGSLWIGDVFYAYQELGAWLGETHQMIAAVSFGYADESPNPRPRRAVQEVTRWR